MKIMTTAAPKIKKIQMRDSEEKPTVINFNTSRDKKGPAWIIVKIIKKKGETN